MNVMWRSCESLLGWTQCHWPGLNPETRCDMLIHTRESIHIHVKTELVTIRNILVRLLNSIADSRCQLQVMQHNAILIYGWSMSVNIQAEK